MPKKKSSSKISRTLAFWQRVTAAALKKMPYDLSARQTAILLYIYVAPAPHSIKNLSRQLSISKPAVCRAVDVLEHARLIKRSRDRSDLRNILIQRTVKGSGYLKEYASLILQASRARA